MKVMVEFQKSLLALFFLVLLINFSPSMGSSHTKVIVELEPAVGDVKHHIDSKLAKLRSLGYNFDVVGKLHNVMQGAVIRISSDQLERLKNEDIVSNVYTEKFLKTDIDNTLKLIHLDKINSLRDSLGRQFTGEGVRIAVVDTGIDYTHKDLLGFGVGGKVVGGYDFLERDNEPMDTDGHGTLVAGIIAADGETKGVAPKAQLIAYRIASGGSYVSTVDMIRAFDRAVDDKANIVNISLGLDYVSEEIDKAVENLVKHGVIVVAAAGNSGGTGKGIGSPASAQTAISVGASLNNVTSLLSTLRIKDDTKYDSIPMFGSAITNEPVKSRLVYANFATQRDVEGMVLNGAIVLAERGGPVVKVDGKEQTEIVYFSDKVHNVASKGADALIIYNNILGAFRGTVVHDANTSNYKPSIPVVSISREDGLKIKEMIDKGSVDAELKVFYNTNPDIVAPFSSHGPVSPFYTKPDLVAPGAFVNSTMIGNSYNVVSGTSFAAPFVTGAVALLLQKDPKLQPAEVASILATTAEPIADLYGSPYPFEVAGSGRLNVVSALESNIVAIPHYVIIHLSSAGSEASRTIELRPIGGKLGELNAKPEWNNEPVSLKAYIEKTNSTQNLVVNAKLLKNVTGTFEGRVYIESAQNKISIPVIVYADEVGVKASNKDGRIWLSIDMPDRWKFAKVEITNPDGKDSHSTTLTPSSNISSVPASTVGEHWIEADVVTDAGDAKGFSVLYVRDTSPDGMLTDYQTIYGIPLKEAFMIAAFLGVAVTVAIVWTRRNGSKGENTLPSVP